jgi:5-methylcytosine-specific restriction protein B
VQYFSIDRIKQASRHLENFRSGWVLVPFVLAADSVNSTKLTDLHSKNGTDALLDRYFSGDLIGLKAGSGGNALRPRFKETLATFETEGRANDFAINQPTKLWANAYSSRGYREMVQIGVLENDGSSYKLTATFQPKFEQELPATFHFEELLVWLYAFKGIPDEVNSWSDLLKHLLDELKVEGGQFAAEFRGRFALQTGERAIPWPTDNLSTRPSDEEYQKTLMPSLSASGAQMKVVSKGDPVLAKVLGAIDAGERNFLFYGPPGTGKTIYAHDIALYLTDGHEDRIAKIQFHPSLSYDDFVEGYSPKQSAKGGSLSYDLTPRHFLLLRKAAAAAKNQTFVLVIDEISRGDASRVMGDLLTYIDKDYREQKFRLSYSGEIVSIPSNIIILATTNPYDRSIAELDDALLRRFYMIEFPPSKDALENHFKQRGLDGDYSKKVLHLFSELNRKMPHGFGHSHFFRLEGPTQLREEWQGKLRFLIKRAFQFDAEVMADIDKLVDELFPVKPEANSTNEAPQTQ